MITNCITSSRITDYYLPLGNGMQREEFCVTLLSCWHNYPAFSRNNRTVTSRMYRDLPKPFLYIGCQSYRAIGVVRPNTLTTRHKSTTRRDATWEILMTTRDTKSSRRYRIIYTPVFFYAEHRAAPRPRGINMSLNLGSSVNECRKLVNLRSLFRS